MTMLAYHSDAALKWRVLEKIAAHRQADEIAQGAYAKHTPNGMRYCAVGCVLEDPDGGHERYAAEFGIPEQLAHLEDAIFEALPSEDAQTWPERFMAAIPVGADLAPVWPRFAAWLMVDETWGVASTTPAEDVRDVCRRVAVAYRTISDGGSINGEDAQAITEDAWDAWDAWTARDAWAVEDVWAARATWDAWVAGAAWDARAARVAWDARDARTARDAWAVEDVWAARATWDAWDARDARAAFVTASADNLIELLEAATQPQPNAQVPA